MCEFNTGVYEAKYTVFFMACEEFRMAVQLQARKLNKLWCRPPKKEVDAIPEVAADEESDPEPELVVGGKPVRVEVTENVETSTVGNEKENKPVSIPRRRCGNDNQTIAAFFESKEEANQDRLTLINVTR